MNAPPLVVHIVYALGTGGLENGLVNIINRMPGERYRHVILCLTKSGNFADRITASNVRIIELDKQPGHDLKAFWRLWKILKGLKPAIIHTRNLAALEMQLIALFVPGARRVHGEHGRDIYDLEGKNRKYNLLRQFMSRVVQRYICVSRDLYDWLIEVIGVKPEKVIHIYNGVDQDNFTPMADESARLPLSGLSEDYKAHQKIIIGTVGRLAEVKNQESLISVMAILKATYPELTDGLRLMVVGDGPLRQQLEDKIATLSLENEVVLLGNRDDIPALLGEMDIFVLPSLGEGISNTVLEAMASALPVIATDVGGNPELVDSGVNGLLVPVSDDKALADAIRRLVLDEELRKAMGQAGLAKVKETFNWSRAVQEYLDVYDELLN